MDATSDIHALIPQLSELELACLICLVADKHGIIRAPQVDLDAIEKELSSISARTFGFSSTIVHCSSKTTLEDISQAALEEDYIVTEDGGRRASAIAFHSTRSPSKGPAPTPTNILDERKTCNVIIARDLDHTESNVQIQALELMRSRRIYSRSAAHGTPKRFLFITLLSETTPGPPFLTPHLNDQFFTLHDYNLQNHTSRPTSLHSGSSLTSLHYQTSILHRRPTLKTPSHSQSYTHNNPPITDAHLTRLKSLLPLVRPSAAISRYLHDIPTFLRLHRHVAGGISALATRHLLLLCTILAVLQLPPESNVTVDDASASDGATGNPLPPVITPMLATLAAYKVYGHRVELIKEVEGERSMQWGSDWEAVSEALRGASVQGVLDESVGGLIVPA